MITISNLTKIFNKGKTNEFIALHDISISISDGESIAIMGKSGSGKTTLLHIIAGIESLTQGQVIIDELDITALNDSALARYRAKSIGLVMQDFNLIDECTALNNVMVPLNFMPMKNKKRKERSITLIKGVGLEEYINKPVSQLSGGEKQRIAIARALAADAPYILADEPTGALDTGTSKDIIDMLMRINGRGKTVIIVTHNPQVAKACSRIITLSDGCIVSDEKSSQNEINEFAKES